MTEKRRTLIIGGGSIGERHLRCFQQTGRADVMLCEINDDLRETLRDRYQLAQVFGTFEEALAAKPDIAVICTPAHLHIPMARQLAERDISFLMEKPVSTSLEGVAELATLIDEKNLLTGVAYVHRSNPLLAGMRDAIRAGRFGKPLQINGISGQHFPYYRPAYREIYYTKHETGGGAIQDALTHLLNLGEWFVGPITDVVADADHNALEGVEVEDSVNVLARHSRLMGSYTLNQHQSANETQVTVICENATVRFEGHKGRWSYLTEPETEWQLGEELTFERDTLFINQANAFLDCWAQRTPFVCTLGEGVQTLKVALAILESVSDKSWKKISV
ncbi:MAG: Gfo/Idh/MocA family oxidoreductase [Planctomycetaceae bacterium]|nr:Gfo/Idh/MocA family oxidoreductase [Planctomycetaceae bacterium]